MAGATMYAAVDDAPFAVPAGVVLHYAVTVTNAAQTLVEVTDLVTTDPHVVPSFTSTAGDVRYPKAMYLAHMNTAHDVWMTWDGVDPVVGTTAPIGVKLPPTYQALRVPVPAAIKAGTIKFLSDQAGGTPVTITYEF